MWVERTKTPHLFFLLRFISDFPVEERVVTSKRGVFYCVPEIVSFRCIERTCSPAAVIRRSSSKVCWLLLYDTIT